MEPADLIKINLSVEEARKIIQPRTWERTVVMCITSSIRSEKFTPVQAEAALVLAWNDLLTRARFRDEDLKDHTFPYDELGELES